MDSESFNITTGALESGKTQLPDFVSFDGFTFTIVPSTSDVGVYRIEVSLSDGYMNEIYTFSIIVEPQPVLLTTPL